MCPREQRVFNPARQYTSVASIEEIAHRYPGFERGYRRGREEAALIHDSERDIKRVLETIREIGEREKYVAPAVAEYIKQLEGVPLSEEAAREYGMANAGEALGYIVGQTVWLMGRRGLKHARDILTSIIALPPEAAAKILQEHILPLVKTPRYLLWATRRDYRDPRIDRALRAITRIRKKAAIRTTAKHLRDVYAATGGKLRQLEQAKKDISAAREALEQGNKATAKSALQSRVEAIRSREDLRDYQKDRAINRYQRIMDAIDRGSHDIAIAELKRIEKAIDHDISILSKNGDQYSSNSMQHIGKTNALSIGRSEFDVEDYTRVKHLAESDPGLIKLIESALDEMDAEIGHANRISHYLRNEMILKNLTKMYGMYWMMRDENGLKMLKDIAKELAKGNSTIAERLQDQYMNARELEEEIRKSLPQSMIKQ